MAKRITTENSFRLHGTNYLMPKIGCGTWKVPTAVCENVVSAAIQHNYGLIDCAAHYGNEKAIGRALNKAIQHDKLLQREDIFITSKLWNTDHAPKDVKSACQRTLRDLKLEYLDLYLMHFPVAWPNRRQKEEDYPEGFNKDFYGLQTETTVFETWNAMEELVDAQLVKNIGVSNFCSSLIWELDKVATKPISVNQIELHPLLPEHELVQLCHSKNIAVTAYSTFASLSYQYNPVFKSLPSLLEADEIKEMAQRYNATPAQILLSWVVNTRHIAAIPKTRHTQRFKENLKSLDIMLDEHDVHVIDGFNRGLRFNDRMFSWGISLFA